MTLKRILITGAAGGLGQMLRPELKDMAEIIRLSSRRRLEPTGPHEEFMPCDLADAPAVDRLLEGVDAVVHMGGQASEAPWDVILSANIIGAINLWEAARKAGTQRIIFASSNHAIGLYTRDDRLDHNSPAKPDGRYGLSKAFGEDLASLYAHKHGIRAMCMRIGSTFPKPKSRRMLSTWMSYPDMVQMTKIGLTADYLYEIVYGVSDNDRNWWDNSNAYRLGFRPQDNAETFVGDVEGIGEATELAELFQGGRLAATEYEGGAR
ncbi:NAD(P)-dependent oxidoreductase [Bosea sp. BK604]|uniref:NAD-dependent epimerase/dehydratase family protein n=1 Tax=Bosea sp. BK604 TaxID=2512180 RepID=UPI0010475B74|nr:NAD(P)-dependent oxidoreductase [Bosea sp. BK604]TCR66392.1 uronate dehydrogenase [Bosea sp. BK604]